MRLAGRGVSDGRPDTVNARRPFAAAVLLAASMAIGLPAAAAAGQDDARRVRLESLDVSDNLYLLRGGGNNILALVREDSVVLVDTLGVGWGAATRAALDNLTTAPVTMIINSHDHAGHTAGNVEFPHVTEVVAHENARRRMEAMDAFSGDNARFLPTRTFSDTLTLLDGVDRVELHHFGASHTDADAVVVFPDKGIAFMGDLFANTAPPYVDAAAGGSAAGYPDVLAAVLDELSYFPEFVRGPEVRTFDMVVPGHQEPPDLTPLLAWLTWADLERYAAFTRELVDAASAARAAGRSADEAEAAARALADRYPEYDMVRLRLFVDTAFSEAGGVGR